MGMLNRQSREQRKMLRDNRDALRDLELAESDRQDMVRARERDLERDGRAASDHQAPARVLVDGVQRVPGQRVAKLPTVPEKGEKTQVESVEATKVMPTRNVEYSRETLDEIQSVGQRGEGPRGARVYAVGPNEASAMSPQARREFLDNTSPRREPTSELDGMLAKLPTFKKSDPEVGGPSL